MSNTTQPKETWTPADEARLVEMTQRRDRVKAAQMAPVIEMARHIIELARTASGAKALAMHLANNADAIRDALAPFDSGVRPAKGEG